MSLQSLSPKASALKERLERFVEEKCIPAEAEYDEHISKFTGNQRWTEQAVPPVIEKLKAEARSLGFWNMFLPHPLPDHLLTSSDDTATTISPRFYMTNREYGVLAEVTGRSALAPEACNCNAPDTGNMEVLLKCGTKEQQIKFLKPLLRGEIRSTFLMTEPDVASSDARNLETRLTKIVKKDGSVKYILNGKKWWSTGAMDPRCKVAFVVAKMDFSHPSCTPPPIDEKSKRGQQTIVIVPMPHPGLKCVRPLTVFGYDDAPHGHAEVQLENIELDEGSVVLGEGKGFEISQIRLGPGRIHHCMRAVGLAARCYELMLERTFQRRTFGKDLHQHGSVRDLISDSKSDLESARLLTLACAEEIDRLGAKEARDKIAMIKVVVPQVGTRSLLLLQNLTLTFFAFRAHRSAHIQSGGQVCASVWWGGC